MTGSACKRVRLLGMGSSRLCLIFLALSKLGWSYTYKKNNLKQFHLADDVPIPKIPFVCNRAAQAFNDTLISMSAYQVMMDCAALYLSGFPDTDSDVEQWMELRDRINYLLTGITVDRRVGDKTLQQVCNEDIERTRMKFVVGRETKVKGAQLVALVWRYALAGQQNWPMPRLDAHFVETQIALWKSTKLLTRITHSPKIKGLLPRSRMPAMYLYLSPFADREFEIDDQAIKSRSMNWARGEAYVS